MISLLQVQKMKDKVRPKEFKFKLPDELADRMKKEYERAKKIADAKAQKDKVEQA